MFGSRGGLVVLAEAFVLVTRLTLHTHKTPSARVGEGNPRGGLREEVVQEASDGELEAVPRHQLVRARKEGRRRKERALLLPQLDERLVAKLEAGDIRLLRVKWVEVQPDGYSVQRRQEGARAPVGRRRAGLGG